MRPGSRTFQPDPPLNERALRDHAARLGVRVWSDPDKPEQGAVFCKKCGFGGDVKIVLARWAADPIGCFRRGDTACDGRVWK